MASQKKVCVDLKGGYCAGCSLRSSRHFTRVIIILAFLAEFTYLVFYGWMVSDVCILSVKSQWL
ncbi:hypothetical protein Hanom_Chr12g01104021 [Helianthus anomalus]